MDLKFTFGAASDSTPQNLGIPARSSELYLRVRELDDAGSAEHGFEAAAVSGDEVRYAHCVRPLRAGEAPEIGLRSAISRIIAELDAPLNTTITQLQITDDLLPLLVALNGVSAGASPDAYHTTQALQLRTGLLPETPVTIHKNLAIPAQ